MLSGVSSVPIRDAKGSVDHGLRIFIAEVLEVEGTPKCQCRGTHAKLSRVGTILLNCQSSGISRVSTSRLQEFCCTLNSKASLPLLVYSS